MRSPDDGPVRAIVLWRLCRGRSERQVGVEVRRPTGGHELIAPGLMSLLPLALIGVLGTQHHLSQGKVRDLLAQVPGLDFTGGAVSQAHGKVAVALAAPVHEAARTLLEAPVKNVDETRCRRQGRDAFEYMQARPHDLAPQRARSQLGACS